MYKNVPGTHEKYILSPFERSRLKRLLLSLTADKKPLWGKMKPQQMVEHLVGSVEYTNGKKVTACERPAELAAREKQLFIYDGARIPKNVFLGELPSKYRYPNLETAIKNLMKELEDFDKYYEEPGITAIHGGFGPMDHNEWMIWHSKHFTHHFVQFGLLPEE